MEPIFVSAADSAYFPLLKGLVHSLRRHSPTPSPKIIAFDLGLTPAQKCALYSLEVQLLTIDQLSQSAVQRKHPLWVQLLTARADLPRYLPNAEMIIWIDADAWLQDWRAIDLMVRAAAHGSLGVVPEIHRGYAQTYQPDALEQHQ